MGTYDPEEGGIKTVKFGPLFYKYADISDTLGEFKQIHGYILQANITMGQSVS